jgi:DNA-binding transcriptional regulator YhcF (GntR family)
MHLEHYYTWMSSRCWMFFSIDPTNGVAIYEQIVRQVKFAVAEGTLCPGQLLPSVRQLGLQLAINPNTIARAYQQLQADQVIETLRGRGLAVCAGATRALPRGPPVVDRRATPVGVGRGAARRFEIRRDPRDCGGGTSVLGRHGDDDRGRVGRCGGNLVEMGLLFFLGK